MPPAKPVKKGKGKKGKKGAKKVAAPAPEVEIPPAEEKQEEEEKAPTEAGTTPRSQTVSAT